MTTIQKTLTYNTDLPEIIKKLKSQQLSLSSVIQIYIAIIK